MNVEGDTTEDTQIEAKVYKPGGTVWILGMKTEDAGTVIKTVDGGRTELLGHLHVGHRGEAPCLVTVDSDFTAAVTSAEAFPVAAVETRDGESRTAGHFNMADLYCARRR